MSITQRQLEIEQEMVTGGIDRYRKSVERGLEASEPGLMLMRRVLDPLRLHLQETFTRNKQFAAGRHHAALPFIRDIDPAQLSFITWRQILNGIQNMTPYTSVAYQVGSLIEEHMEWIAMFGVAPGLVKTVTAQLKRATTTNHRRAVAGHLARKVGVDYEWTNRDCISVGTYLLMCAEQSVEPKLFKKFNRLPGVNYSFRRVASRRDVTQI